MNEIENEEQRMLAAFESIAESLKIIAAKPPAIIQLCPGCENMKVIDGDDLN